MENKKWLPSDTRNRLIDLCKSRNISQSQLAGVIGVDRSALSRFLRGKTDSLSHEHVIQIARFFNVSTDFLLGETDDPGRINYDIAELGLTVKAAERLFTRKVDPAVLCRLLEHDRCGELIHEIGLYLDDTMAAGIAAQNQLFNSLSNLLRGHAAEHPEDKPGGRRCGTDSPGDETAAVHRKRQNPFGSRPYFAGHEKRQPVKSETGCHNDVGYDA